MAYWSLIAEWDQEVGLCVLLVELQSCFQFECYLTTKQEHLYSFAFCLRLGGLLEPPADISVSLHQSLCPVSDRRLEVAPAENHAWVSSAGHADFKSAFKYAMVPAVCAEFV